VRQPPTEDESEVLAVNWETFLRWFGNAWREGDHVSLIGPTNSGKTTVGVQICQLRPWVIAIDIKGDDETLGKSGWARVTKWPLPGKVYDRMAQGEDFRVILGDRARGSEAMARRRMLARRALEDIWKNGGWTVLVDDLQLLTDTRKSGNLSLMVEDFLVAARDAKVSIVSLQQAPRRVPRAASDQSSWLIAYVTRDTDIVNRLAEMAGRPRAEIRGAIRGLRRPYILVFSTDSEAPIVMTRPERLG
jgi:hypothetical protein